MPLLDRVVGSRIAMTDARFAPVPAEGDAVAGGGSDASSLPSSQ
jgi:hypothetical protein